MVWSLSVTMPTLELGGDPTRPEPDIEWATLSGSTKAAFRWARANAEQRREDVVTSPDLLFGMIKAHPTDAEPLQLLDHARVPHRKLDDALADWARSRTDSKDPYVKPRRPAPLHPDRCALGLTRVGRQVVSECVVPDPCIQPKRRRRSEFVTTDTLLKAMAPAAIIGLSNPAAARGIAATL